MAVNVMVSAEEIRALLEAGFLFRERGEIDKSVEVFEGVLALRPELEVAHIGLANALQVKGDAAGAEKSFRKATSLYPQSALARMQLGEFLYTQGRRDDATAELDKAIELDASGPHGEAARAVKAVIAEGVEYSYQLPS